MRTKDSGTVTTVVAVDPARAFEVFTKEIGAWWRREPRYRFHPEKNGVMRFEPGTGGCLVEVHDPDTGQGFEVGRVLVWEPGHRLVFEFRGRDSAPGERTEVEVRFAPSGAGTRIVLEHRGWSALRPDHPARRGYSGPAFTDMIGLQWPTAPGHDGGDAAASRARCTEGGGGFMKTWLVLFPPALSAPAIAQEPPASPDPQVGRTAQLLLGRGSGEMTANVPARRPTRSRGRSTVGPAGGRGASCSMQGSASIGLLTQECLLAYAPEDASVHYMCVTSMGEVHDHRGRWIDERTLEFEPLPGGLTGQIVTETLRWTSPTRGASAARPRSPCPTAHPCASTSPPAESRPASCAVPPH